MHRGRYRFDGHQREGFDKERVQAAGHGPLASKKDHCRDINCDYRESSVGP